jgi:hypothetical protein
MRTWIDYVAEGARLFWGNEPEPEYTTLNSDGAGPNATVRIKGENPPRSTIERQLLIRQKKVTYVNYLCIFGGVMLFLMVVCVLSDSPAGFVLFGILAALGFRFFFYPQGKELFEEADRLKQKLFLDAYNTEFIAPLADRSTLRITVHFQIPRDMNAPHFTEQLNRVTEAKLIMYTQRFATPPSRLDIQDCLNRELVQFQDENNVSVFRVDVPITIHVHPDKPKGVYV